MHLNSTWLGWKTNDMQQVVEDLLKGKFISTQENNLTPFTLHYKENLTKHRFEGEEDDSYTYG